MNEETMFTSPSDEGQDVEQNQAPSSKTEQEGGQAYKLYEDLQKKKGWKTYDDAAKSYKELESSYGRLANENKQLRDWINQVGPYLPAFQKWYEEQVNKTEVAEEEEAEEEEAELSPKALKKLFQKDPEGMKQLFNEIMGGQLEPLKIGVQRMEIANLLNVMSNDKENFPLFDKETEAVMSEIVKELPPGAIPLTIQGMKVLYDAAIGRRWKDLSKSEREKAMNEAYKSFQEKMVGGYVEPEEGVSEFGQTDEDKKIIDAILKAGSKRLF